MTDSQKFQTTQKGFPKKQASNYFGKTYNVNNIQAKKENDQQILETRHLLNTELDQLPNNINSVQNYEQTMKNKAKADYLNQPSNLRSDSIKEETKKLEDKLQQKQHELRQEKINEYRDFKKANKLESFKNQLNIQQPRTAARSRSIIDLQPQQQFQPMEFDIYARYGAQADVSQTTKEEVILLREERQSLIEQQRALKAQTIESKTKQNVRIPLTKVEIVNLPKLKQKTSKQISTRGSVNGVPNTAMKGQNPDFLGQKLHNEATAILNTRPKTRQ